MAAGDARHGRAALIRTLANQSKPAASHVNDTLAALADQIEPSSSNDQAVPRFTWWDHKGTTEFVQYEFAQPAAVSGVEVYWFDDTGAGQCRVPAEWRILAKSGNDWKPIEKTSACKVAANTYNRVTFDPVTAEGLRLVVKLQPDFSGGILEWRIIQP